MVSVPTLNSPTAHIQSEIQGSFSVTPGLKLNKGDVQGAESCRFNFPDWLINTASLATYCDTSCLFDYNTMSLYMKSEGLHHITIFHMNILNESKFTSCS